MSDPAPHTTSSTVYVHDASAPPKGQYWKLNFKWAFDRISGQHAVPSLRPTLTTVSYAQHYPNILCLRISHTPGLSNSDLTQSLQFLAKEKTFGPANNQFSISRTFTDIVVTFEGNTNLPAQATTSANQIAKHLG